MSMNNCCSGCASCAETVGWGVAGVVFIAAHPVIGLLAQPILGIKAIVEGILLNYHWRHSMDERGVALCNDCDGKGQPYYMNRNKEYKVEDLTRFEHEKERIEYRDKLFETLKLMRGLAKCIIPVIGLIWSFLTEINAGGSAEFGCYDDNDYITDKQAVQEHIDKIKRQQQQWPKRNMTNLTTVTERT